jgi:hypothetical protein
LVFSGLGESYDIRVFPIPLFVVIIMLMLFAIIGAAVGALSGKLGSLITKCGPQGVSKDALLGSLGFLAGFFGSVFMPFPRNTIVQRLPGGGTVETSMNSYQHPGRVAFVVAFLLPLLYELYRFKRTRPKADQDNGLTRV